MGLLCLNNSNKIIIGREKVGNNYIPIINKYIKYKEDEEIKKISKKRI